MRLRKNGFLSFVLISVLLASSSREVSAYGIHDCMERIQHFDTALFLSELSRHFLPIAALAGIAALLTFRWYKNRNVRQLSQDEECGRVKRFVQSVLEDNGGEEQNGVMFGERLQGEYLKSGYVKCGKEEIPGIQCPPFNGIVVQQLPVLHQDTKNKVDGDWISVGSGSASCGYHAIKNQLVLLTQGSGMVEKSLSGTELPRYLFAMSSDKVCLGAWREKIRVRRGNGDNDGEWLNEPEINVLMQGIEDLDVGYFVIDNVDALDVLTDDVEKAKGAIQQNGNRSYVFFVNTGGESLGSMGQLVGCDGHWFTMVLKKEAGKRFYTIMDSKNIVRLYNDKWVKKVTATFEEEAKVADQLVLSEKSLNIMKGGIEQLLENKGGSGGDGKRRMKLQELTTRYQSWGGKMFSDKLQKSINQCFADDE